MNNKLELSNLDFAGIKTQLKDYLKTQTRFKDYDFEGSNMSVLLDVLAYNTYQNNFYTNMAISEMFLDSAQLENSVTSHAKELNYLPRSTKAAKALVKISINDANETAFLKLIPAKTKFTTDHRGDNYTFYTVQNHFARRIGTSNIFETDSIEIFEGIYVTEKFIYKADQTKFILTNENIDVGTIICKSNDSIYTRATTISGVEKEDLVYYLEPYFNEKYSIEFGRNIFGAEPSVGDNFEFEYIVTNGDASNGAFKFTSNAIANSKIITIEQATGGAPKESLESIKFYAPKSIQVQDRAIAARDYEIILKNRYPEISAISVFGGDELVPPKYGKVAISVKLKDSSVLSNNKKSEYRNFISEKNSLTISPIFVDPIEMNVDTKIAISYYPNQLKIAISELEKRIRESIIAYSSNRLENFKAYVSSSDISSIILRLDPSIKTAIVNLDLILNFSPRVGVVTIPSFDFSSKLKRFYPYTDLNGLNGYTPSFKSTNFTGASGVESYLQDDGNGNIQLVSANKVLNQILDYNFGTINYETGLVNLNSFVTSGYEGNSIRMYTKIDENEIDAKRNIFLSIIDKDISITFKDINK